MENPPDAPPARQGAARANEPPDALQVLAELELVRRKSALLERRVAAWENELVEIRQQVEALQKARDPDAEAYQDAIGELRHRVGRLERRRAAAAEAPAAEPLRAPPRPLRLGAPSFDEDAVAIVRPEWVPTEAAPGDTVQLIATADGIAKGDKVKFTVRSLVEEQPLAEVQAVSDGERLVGSWRVPADPPWRELFFDVDHQGAQARSSVLVLPLET
jgi:hypothetical protein